MSPSRESAQKPAGPRIGLALGSGAARGWAHIGIIQALEALGIEPAVVAGSSVGALVGAAHVRGRLEALETWVRGLGWDWFLRYGDVRLAGGGVVSGRRLVRALSPVIGDERIEHLPRPFACVATDLTNGREVWLQEGSLMEAVRASIAIPGVFTPVRGDHEHWLVDGGLVNPVPVSLCHALGADVVIAVNLNADVLGRHADSLGGGHLPTDKAGREELAQAVLERLPRFVRPAFEGRPHLLIPGLFSASRRSPGLLDVVMSALDIMQDRITRSRLAGDPADVVLQPRLGGIGLLEFDRAEEAIAEGHAVVERMRAALLHALGR